MELMGIADEGAVTIEGQIEVTQSLGWKWIESRFVDETARHEVRAHHVVQAGR